MKRVLSGIKSSGEVTLGNYLGAIKRWVELQPANDGTAREVEHFYFVPNSHALTVRPEPSTLRHDTLSAVAWLLAAGIDPERVTLFVQSQIPAHTELGWIFNNYVTMGELGRMTQFKDKARKQGEAGQLVGMFTYPALMAADILLYDANEVPVGEDQKQHVELTRDIAERFNNLYGETFVLPTATLPEVGARIMNLQNPTAKMSKSDQDASGNILLTDSTEVIRQKLSRAVTDSGNEIKVTTDKPAVTNLIEILSATTNQSTSAIEQQFTGSGYGEFKQAVADAVVEHIEPIQQRYAELMGNERKLLAIIEDGREKASLIAEAKLDQVKQTIGLL